MERSSTIFAISSHFYDSSYNRGHYHRAAAWTPAVPNSRKPRTGHAATPAYTWIVEQELAALSREISETRRWVFEQQVHFGLLPKGTGTSAQPPPRMRTGEKRRRDPDPAFAGRGLDGEMAWLRERLRAAQRDAERSQLQEEFDKMEARWRREEGRQRRQECHRAGEQRGREERQNQAAVERRRQAEAWKAYERQWAAIAIGKDDSRLTFRSVPWPMTLPPRSAREVTSEAVAKFILSHAHSEGVSRKDRIKSALRRWHPDRFGRILNRVDVKDRAAVERAVGTVARCLNDLLAREN